MVTFLNGNSTFFFDFDINQGKNNENDISSGKLRVFKYECFCWSSHLKYDFGHEKMTFQKWCLEVHRTFSNDSRDKKRFSKGWTTQNDLFYDKTNIL